MNTKKGKYKSNIWTGICLHKNKYLSHTVTKPICKCQPYVALQSDIQSEITFYKNI